MKFYITSIFLCLAIHSAYAQHNMDDMDSMPGMDHKSMNHNHKAMDNDDMAHDHMAMDHAAMGSSLSLNLLMTRDGSGTSWLPDASPMYGYMLHKGKWMFMFHGDIFPRYNSQDVFKAGSRGGSKWDAPDMLMAMAQRRLGKKGLLHFNVMLSTDALITGGSGYPLLFQTGESWQGRPLVDRQHPHDLFSELSASYAYSFNKKTDVSIYVGYPGEPALGPCTFMHRPSGEFMPDAPISHHWADATHITFGVATVGFRYGKFKLEGSSFTGREPDEDRYNFDKPTFDSWSGRLSFNPNANFSFQASHGYINGPEALHPDENINRTTASGTYVKEWKMNHYVAATLLWGQNVIAGEEPSNAVLAEATVNLNKWAVYGRYDWVQKSTEELNIVGSTFGLPATLCNVSALTGGLAYDVYAVAHLNFALGGQLAFYFSQQPLHILYGNVPIGAEIYLHIYPERM